MGRCGRPSLCANRIWWSFPVIGQNREISCFSGAGLRGQKADPPQKSQSPRPAPVNSAPVRAKIDRERYSTGTGIIFARNRDHFRKEQGSASSGTGTGPDRNRDPFPSKHSARRCSAQAGGMRILSNWSSVGAGGWRPSRIACWISGARNTSLQSRRSYSFVGTPLP